MRVIGALVGGFLGLIVGGCFGVVVFKSENFGVIAAFSTAFLGLIGGWRSGPGIARRLSAANFNQVMAEWDGSDANDLIASYGTPKRVLNEREGGKIFIYIFDRARTPPGVAAREFANWFDGKGVRTTYRPSEAGRYLAFRVFWINSQNRVYRGAWNGR